MSVELSQKGSNVRVAIAIDGASILADYESRIDSIESQRAAGLADNVDSEGVATPKTPEQIASVNATHDAMIVAEKRMLQIRFLDACRSELSQSIERVSYSDDDFEAAKVAEKSKIDAEFALRDSKKPTVDADAAKALAR